MRNETVTRIFGKRLKNSGLFFFPLPLHDEEKELRLNQKQAMPVPPRDYCNVISLNSTYLEIVDAAYQERGSSGFWGGAIAVAGSLLLFVAIVGFCKFLGEPDPLGVEWGYFVALGFPFFILLSGFFVWAGISMAKVEVGQYTHYPIRFNRKNRKVYCFQHNGKVIASAWDDIFFYFHSNNRTVTHTTFWGVRANILDQDRNTVKAGFALPVIHSNPLLPAAFWEFVRRYMEDGVRNLPKIRYCLPLSDKKETAALAAFKMQPAGSGYSSAMAAAQSFDRFGRRLVNATCKIPVWPDWVEVECLAEMNDDLCQTSAHNCLSMNASLAKEIGDEDETFFNNKLCNADIGGTLLERMLIG